MYLCKFSDSPPRSNCLIVTAVAVYLLCLSLFFPCGLNVRALKVKKLPHMEIYAGERGRLASFVCGPSKSGLLKDKLDRLLADPLDPSLGTAPPALSPASLGPS